MTHKQKHISPEAVDALQDGHPVPIQVDGEYIILVSEQRSLRDRVVGWFR